MSQPETTKPQAPGQGKPLELLEGTVERIVFTNPETSFTIAGLKPDGTKSEITIVGNFAGLQPQEVLRLEGEWIHDKRYGRQFKVERYTSVLPSTAGAIEKYLGSGLIKGIGKVYAKRLVEHFGTEVLDIIEHDPSRLHDVEGIGDKRFKQITLGWNEHRAVRDIMMFLQHYGLPQSFAARVYKQYGEGALEQIKRNPYQLALDVRGIGFKSADSIAQKIGIPVESIERSKAGVHFLLQDMASDGHTYYPADSLIAKACEVLGVDQTLIVEAINALKDQNHVALEVLPDGTRAVYLKHLHRNETSVTEHLVRLLNTGKLFPKFNTPQDIAEFEKQFRFELAENQRIAVNDALRGGVLVITGGPGTGKTTIIRAILWILERHGISSLLAAPTGRAAKRMNELTRMPASTIHRLLQFSPQEGKYLRNAQNPLKGDFLILDEASMIDINLASSLLRAVSSTSSVIFVGDVDQLPSVGPGNFLMDLIRSGALPVVRLNKIFRQAQASMIVTNAHRINMGQMPALGGKSDEQQDAGAKRDFHFFDAPDPESALATIRDLVHHRIPAKFGLKPETDIQVLSPMHRGLIGAQNLNRELQQVLNPTGAHLDRGGVSFRTGDKVMQMINNYDKDVFNGDIGFIVSIDREDHMVKVNFDGRIVTYDFNEMDELELAYCISVHKSQGSEYKAVVMPVHTTHYVMLQRNLLYTGITRGKVLVCLVGQRRAVSMAVNNVSAEPRFSGLDQRLRVLRQENPSPSNL